MHVIVDGVVYGRQRFGGINTYFNQVLPLIARHAHTRVDLLLPRERQGTPPGPPVHWLPRDFIPPRTSLSWRVDQKLEPILESLKLTLFGLWAKTKTEAVFHSTYFTSLPVSVPQVAMAHDMNHERFPELYRNAHGIWLRRRYREYLRTATRIIAVSETTKNHVEQYYSIGPELIDVIYHAVDSATFYRDRQEQLLQNVTHGCGISLPYILYVGSRSPYKNFPALLNAMDRLYRRTGLTLVVAGPRWDERESAEIPVHPAAPALRLVPHPDDDLLRLLYSFATAFVFPSRYEGFGIPILEAMACGAPVVASDTAIFHEVAGSAPMYFNPDDPDDLARAIEQCLDEGTARGCRERGLLQVAKYSWDRTSAQTRAVYEKALGAQS
jgi:glycosyltransferase involved in cell wall biosynthesis